MSKSNFFENALLKAVFHNLAIAGISLPGAGASLFVGFHTGDPGEGGAQNVNEAAYTGYARVAVLRDATGWTITANSVSPAANIEAPVCTAAPGADLTHFSIGVAGAGATDVLYKGTLAPVVVMHIGVFPRLTVGTTVNEE